MPVSSTAEPVTVHLRPATSAELDALAQSADRDREAIIQDAIDAYLALNRWQVAQITEGLRQAEAGDFATDAEVRSAFTAFR